MHCQTLPAMRLPFLRSKDDPAAERSRGGGAVEPAVEASRRRARQRLAGALVLLGLGVIGFPILFETQPRPLPADTPIEVLRPEGGGQPAPASTVGRSVPPSLPPADAGNEALPADTASLPVPALSAGAQPAVEKAGDKALDKSPDKPVDNRPEKPVEKAPGKPVDKPQDKALDKAVDKPPAVAALTPPAATAAKASAAAAAPGAATAASAGDDGQRARALLTAGAASTPAAPRFVVQAGAYTDAAAVRDARQKVEKLGLKTYTQVIESEAGKRTRVRVGPFDTRQEADAVAARVKGAGVQAAVLTL